MKKTFEMAEIELIRFDTGDIVTGSASYQEAQDETEDLG